MRKLLILALLTTLVVGALSVSLTAAQDMNGGLASHFPADTVIYAELRTDDGAIADLDGVFTQMARQLPGVMPPISFSLLIDQAAVRVTGSDFAASIRPWLGDHAALGLSNLTIDQYGNMDEPSIIIAIEITNRDVAADFVRHALSESNPPNAYRDLVTANAITLTPRNSSSDPFFRITDDVLYVTTADMFAVVGGDMDASLAESADFSALMGMLPPANHGLTLYFNTADFIAPIMAQMSDQPNFPQFLTQAYSALGSAALGFAVLGDGSLAMDVAQLVGDTSALSDMGMMTDYPVHDPVDLGFLTAVPADSLAVMQGTGLGPNVLAGFENLRSVGDLLNSFIEQGIASGAIGQEAAFLTNFNFGNSAVVFANLAFAGMTGLNLENDVLAWMTGNYALYLRPQVSDNLPFTLDGALLVEATDPDAAQHVVDSIASALEQYQIDFNSETIGDARVLSMPSPLAMLADMNIPNFPFPTEAFAGDENDMVFGTDSSLMAHGTRPGVTFAFDRGEDGGLAADATFVASSENFLPDAQVVMYLNLQPLMPILEANADMMNPTDMQQVKMLLGLLQSASITATADEDGNSVARFVLTLGG